MVFLLRNQLLEQLHTYFYLLPPASNTQLPPMQNGIQNGHADGEETIQLSARVTFAIQICSKHLDPNLCERLAGIERGIEVPCVGHLLARNPLGGNPRGRNVLAGQHIPHICALPGRSEPC